MNMKSNESNQCEQLQSYYLDLRSTDKLIIDLVTRTIPKHPGETTSPFFLPGLYQTVANELCFYRNKCLVNACYSTKSYRNAFFEEDRLSITDEITLIIRDIILNVLNKQFFNRPIRLSFITYNQWVLSYPKVLNGN